MYGWHRKPAGHARQRIPFHMNIRGGIPRGMVPGVRTATPVLPADMTD